MDLVLPSHIVGFYASGYSLSIGIGGGGQQLRAIRECATCSVARQKEAHRGARHRLVVLVLDAHDRLPYDALAQVVYSPFTLHNYDVQLRGKLGLLRPQHSRRQRQQGAKQKADRVPND